MLMSQSTNSKLHMVIYDTPYEANLILLFKRYICITTIESQ